MSAPQKEGKRSRPLYDIPYMYEAREFLRKKLIGKKVYFFITNQKYFPECSFYSFRLRNIVFCCWKLEMKSGMYMKNMSRKKDCMSSKW